MTDYLTAIFVQKQKQIADNDLPSVQNPLVEFGHCERFDRPALPEELIFNWSS